MKNIELYLNNLLLEGLNDSAVQLEYSVKEIQNPQDCTSIYSLDFIIPGTKLNNQIFKNIFEINSETIFNPNANNIAELRVNSVSEILGKLQLNSINKTRVGENESDYYNCTLYSPIRGLYNDLRGKYFKDLDLSLYDSLPTYVNIAATWSLPAITSMTYGCYYPLIDYNIGFDYYLALNGTPSSPSALPLFEIYPAIYNKVIIDQIFKQWGYSYDSTFFNSDAFKRSAIPYAATRPFTTPYLSYFTTNTYSAQPIGSVYTPLYFTNQITNNFDAITQTNNVRWWNTYNIYAFQFKPPITGTYTVHINLSAHDSAAINNWSLYFNEASTVQVGVYPYQTTIPDVNALTTHASISTTNTGITIINGTNILITQADINSGFTNRNYTFQMQATAGFIYIPSLTNASTSGLIISGTSIEILWSTDTGYTANVELEKCLPELVLLTDYLDGLNKLFNLYWEIDRYDTTLVHIEPYEIYYTDTGLTYWDWNSKVDISDIDMEFLGDINNSVVNFKYDNSSDYLCKIYKDKHILEYGEKQVVYTGNTFTDFAEDDVSASPFKPICTYPVWNTGTNSPMNIFVIPTIWTDSTIPACDFANLNTDIGLRILYVYGLISLGNGAWNIWTSNTTYHTNKSYPYAGHILEPFNSTGKTNYDLNYESKYLYYNSSSPSNNLYNLYWKNYYDNLNDKNNRLLSCKVYLNETDISQIRFNDIVVFNEAYWRLNKIKYNVGEKIHDVELIKILDILGYNKVPIWNHNFDILPVTPLNPSTIHPGIIKIGPNNQITASAGVLIGSNNFVVNSVSAITNFAVFGSSNKIYDGSTNTTIYGDNNIITSGASQVFIFGSGIMETQSNQFDINADMNINGDIILNGVSLSGGTFGSSFVDAKIWFYDP